jgi:hypothetical protein
MKMGQELLGELLIFFYIIINQLYANGMADLHSYVFIIEISKKKKNLFIFWIKQSDWLISKD